MADQTPKKDHKERLKGVRGFACRDEILGIPNRLFISILIAAGFWGGAVMRHWSGVILWLLVLGVPMRLIHKHDPKGFQVWSRSVFVRRRRWSAAKAGKRILHIIRREE
jgi:hypothetical protein